MSSKTICCIKDTSFTNALLHLRHTRVFKNTLYPCQARPAVFKVALAKLNLPGHEVLFIEDQQRFKKFAGSLAAYY